MQFTYMCLLFGDEKHIKHIKRLIIGLKMIPIDPNKPIQNENNKRIPPIEDIIFFFKHCFSPPEERFKMILLAQMGLGIRIGEAVAMNLEDIIPGTNCRTWKVRIQKNKSKNK